MCGRLACALGPDQLCNCCWYETDYGFIIPEWIDVSNSGKIYRPSYNICPTEVAPVLVSGSYFGLETRVVAPMVFGLIPPWSKAGEISRYSTVNCRIETVNSSKLYATPLNKGQRCVVICNGFYEWQKQPKNIKKPYFLHCEQPKGIQVDDPSTWNLSAAGPECNNCLRPLRLAALFDWQTAEESQHQTFSFTIITKEAQSELSWLHGRMPAVIESEEQLDVWLNHEMYNSDEALEFISQKNNIFAYPVSNLVNKTLNKDLNCIKPNSEIEKTSKDKNKSVMLMKNWLQKAEKREPEGKAADEHVKLRKKADESQNFKGSQVFNT